MLIGSRREEQFVFAGPVLFQGNLGMVSSRHVCLLIANCGFQGGVTATGNSAMSGGVFYISDGVVNIAGPVSITGNEARGTGGAIWSGAARLTLPADAELSGNTAPDCPGIHFDTGEVVFTDGATYTEASQELCFLDTDDAATTTTGGTSGGREERVEDFECVVYSATAPTTFGHPTLALDTAEVETWNLGTSVTAGFSCPTQLIIYVTGGQDLTVTSTAPSSVMSNVRFEVSGFSKLVLDIPGLTMAGIYKSEVGGALFVDTGSSMDVMNDITFEGNSLRLDYDSPGAWVVRGGAAVYSEGDVNFFGEANFLGNGQYMAIADGYSGWNQDGGALANHGTMQFMKKGTFKDNFNPNGGNGGGAANTGELTFNLRAIFRNNSVGETYTDDGDPYGGRGGALYNEGPDSTVLFKRLAIFQDNVGSLGGCSVASMRYVDNGGDDEVSAADNKITFEGKAKFNDNHCDGDYPSIYEDDDGSSTESRDGGALLVYGASSVDFQDTAVFKRNEAVNGGAIANSASISFVSNAKLFVESNVAAASQIPVSGHTEQRRSNDPDRRGVCHRRKSGLMRPRLMQLLRGETEKTECREK
ncbi:unnamed protein product [Pylaiella littoralis]